MIILLNNRSFKVNVGQHIVMLYSQRDKAGLNNTKNALNEQAQELNTFFEEYLEVFSTQMDATGPTDPVWKAYKDKYKAYETIKSQIKQCDYYLGML
jgi:hypothetical protein